MKKAAMCIAIVIAIASSCVSAVETQGLQIFMAVPSAVHVVVDDIPVSWTGFQVNENNYYMLRDVAKAFSYTGARFNISYENGQVFIQRGKQYQEGSDAIGTFPNGQVGVTLRPLDIDIDGQKKQIVTCNIAGNNFIRLRDLGQSLNFAIDWDKQAQTITIRTSDAALGNENSLVEDTTTKNYPAQIIGLINEERKEIDVGTLKVDDALNQAATLRANELLTQFAHTRPNGQSFHTVLDGKEITYSTTSENIAFGQSTPNQVVNSWLASPKHKNNMLSKEYKKTGVGFATDTTGTLYWVQIFTD